MRLWAKAPWKVSGQCSKTSGQMHKQTFRDSASVDYQLITLCLQGWQHLPRQMGVQQGEAAWEGNPADSAEVQDILTSIKHKASADKGNQKHSMPIMPEHLDQMLQWVCTACPNLNFAFSILRNAHSMPGNGTAQQPPSELVSLEVQTQVTCHLEQFGFASTAWTLWTRLVKSHPPLPKLFF